MLKYLNLKIVFRDEYEELKKEWEEQNAIIDKLTSDCVRLTKKIKKMEELEYAREIIKHTKGVKSTKKPKK